MEELGLKLIVAVAGYDRSGDGAGRIGGGPWTRDSINQDESLFGGYRRVNANTEEGKRAKKRIEEFKKIGKDTGAKIKKELEKKNLPETNQNPEQP